MALEVGSIANGSVIKIMPFGALVKLESGEIGLVHISEVAAHYVENINECVKIGDKVRIKVLEINDDNKMSFSIKKAVEKSDKKKKQEEPKKKVPIRPAEIEWGRKDDAELSFEDKLSKFKQDSDEAFLAIKRSNESKRSGGYKRGGY